MDSTMLPTGVPSVAFAYYCRLTEQVVEGCCQALLFWLYDTTTTLCVGQMKRFHLNGS